MFSLREALRSSPEKTNGAKLSRLIIDGGTLALQKQFDYFHNPSTLQATFNSHYTTLNDLCKKRILNKTQWDLLFPPSRAAPKSSDFDITLLFVLLRNICRLSPPATGWDAKPVSTDTSREANLIRIKWFRNEIYGHVTTTGINARLFSRYWTELSETLDRLGFDKGEVDRLREAPLDEDSYLNLLFDWTAQEDEVKQKLEVIDKKVGELLPKVNLLFDWTTQEDEVKQKLEVIDKKVGELLPKGEFIGDIQCREVEANELGKGSKGTVVYRGTLVSSGKEVAVKKMFDGIFDLREAKRLKNLDHSNIIKCLAVETKEQFIYLALELCDKTLRRCIEDNEFQRKDSHVERLKCLKEITAAVEYLHERKICHRDIKPDNILLSASAPARFILADFNTAKETSSTESASTNIGTYVGTMGYVAPELFKPDENITVKSDLFSLGCVFYYVLSDKGNPFGSVNSLKQCQGNINRGQQPSLEEGRFLEHSWAKPIIEVMISSHPDERPGATDVMKALESPGDSFESNNKGRLEPQVLRGPSPAATTSKLASNVAKLEFDGGRQGPSKKAFIFNAPVRNPCFCGRVEELQSLQKHMKVVENGASKISPVCGLGGTGKTSLVVEHIWLQKEIYKGGVFWLSGDSNRAFQRSVCEMARRLGLNEEDEFSETLSKSLDRLQRIEQLFCLVVNNLDEMELSKDMIKVLVGQWRQGTHGHIVITSRREPRQMREEVGVDEEQCIKLKSLAEEEGVQFLKTRTNLRSEKEDPKIRELVGELGGLPLALDQAAAYIRLLPIDFSSYLEKYKEEKLRLLNKQKARSLVEDTTPQRLAVHTTWTLNFEHVSKMSAEFDLGQAAALVMEMSAYLAPDDIPSCVINQGLPVVENEDLCKYAAGSFGPAEILSILTKFSLFQRYRADSYSVHRLVQEVIRDRIPDDKVLEVLSSAVRMLNFSFCHTTSPLQVCTELKETAVLARETYPSLQLWGRLALHACTLQEHLLRYDEINKEGRDILLYTEQTVRLLSEVSNYMSVCRENAKAFEVLEMKLKCLDQIDKLPPEERMAELKSLSIPLTDRNFRLISECMKQSESSENVGSISGSHAEHTQLQRPADEVEKLRLQGNKAVQETHYQEALDLYTRAIEMSTSDHRLFSNRSLCYLKLYRPEEALQDCDRCLQLIPHFTKAVMRKAWALRLLGNQALKEPNYQKALDLYTQGIEMYTSDHCLFSNRALCYLKLKRPGEALEDCDKCLRLSPLFEKAVMRKAWALHELVKSGQQHLKNRAQAAADLASHIDPTGSCELGKMFPKYSPISVRGSLDLVQIFAPAGSTLLLEKGEYDLQPLQKDLQITGIGAGVTVRCTHDFSVVGCSCHFENVTFPKDSPTIACVEGATVSFHNCVISGGSTSCEDHPECNGGPGCVAVERGMKKPCDRTGKYGSETKSGIGGYPGVGFILNSTGYIDNCTVSNCGGGGVLSDTGSVVYVKKCEIFNNHQNGLEARKGGRLKANSNRVYGNKSHGILVGPSAGTCEIKSNKIFENSREGILVMDTAVEVKVEDNEFYHNAAFGLSLDHSNLAITRNRIFENGFWGVLAKSKTDARITKNDIFSNKCGGIFVGVNYSGRLLVESNVIRDHTGPGLHYEKCEQALPTEKLSPAEMEAFGFPPGETKLYSNPPTIRNNKLSNNEETVRHPRERLQSSPRECAYCHHRVASDAKLYHCNKCNIAAYCSEDCQDMSYKKHMYLCSLIASQFSEPVKIVKDDGNLIMVWFQSSKLKGSGKGPKPDPNSPERFIIKVQTNHINCHPLQLLTVYNRTRAVVGHIQSPKVFNVVMECGVLGELNKFTSKKAYFWAVFEEGGTNIKIFLGNLPPLQEW